MPLDKNEAKAAFKEAIKEWLDEQYRAIGHWTFRIILTAALASLLYFILWADGWRK